MAVDEALLERLSGVCAEVSDLDEDRAEAGRDWWPLAIGWAVSGEVPARPAVVARPTDTEQVAAVLALCHQAHVPVTPAGGRSGVCGASVPLFGGVALDLCGMAGIGRGGHRLARGRPSGRDLRSRRGVRAAGRSRGDPGALAPVHGPLDGGGMAGLPGSRPVLQPLREDRGHGARPRGGAGRRASGPDRWSGSPVGHRTRPDPALRGQRGHPRGHHRGEVPGPPGSGGRAVGGPSGSPPSPTVWMPAVGSCAGAPHRRSSASTTPPSRPGPSTVPTPAC